MTDAVKKALIDKISFLEDDAYRYEKMGGSESDLLVAEKRRKEAEEIKKFLRNN